MRYRYKICCKDFWRNYRCCCHKTCEIDILQTGAIRTVVSQAAIGEPDIVYMKHAHMELAPDVLHSYITERLKLLEFLQCKIDTLNK